MMTSSKNNIFIALTLLVVLIIGGLFLFKDGSDEGAIESDSQEVQGDEVSVSGTIECLPYYISVAGQDCVKSVKGDDGKVYALNSVKGLENALSVGTKVTAVGVFQPANTSVDDSSVFRYDGVLVIRTLQRK